LEFNRGRVVSPKAAKRALNQTNQPIPCLSYVEHQPKESCDHSLPRQQTQAGINVSKDDHHKLPTVTSEGRVGRREGGVNKDIWCERDLGEKFQIPTSNIQKNFKLQASSLDAVTGQPLTDEESHLTEELARF
jgi:hypothetical protein